jgi:predicted membrane protein (TIGR00267 family)
MFVADLIAASIPVIPFALFGLNTARLVSVAITLLLLVVLGIGRAAIGKRRTLTTVLETIGIAAGAAVAGFVIGSLVT